MLLLILILLLPIRKLLLRTGLIPSAKLLTLAIAACGALKGQNNPSACGSVAPTGGDLGGFLTRPAAIVSPLQGE